MKLFDTKESYLGIDIGAGGIKLVELKKTKGRPQLWTYGAVDHNLDIHVAGQHDEVGLASLGSLSETRAALVADEKHTPAPIPVDTKLVSAYADLLSALLTAARVTTRRATASLPVSHVFHAVVTLPTVPEKELEHHVQAKVKKILPRPMEEMQVVHQRIPENAMDQKSKAIKVLVTAAPRELITFYTAIFRAAGIELQELETEAFALERSLVGRDKSTAIIVDIGAERTNFFIIDQGLPMTHRTIQVGGSLFDRVLQERLGTLPGAIGQIKLDIGRMGPKEKWFDFFLPVIDPIVKEIQYSFDLFLHQSGNEGKHPEKIILTGGGSLFPPVAELIQRSFSMRVFVGDPWARVVYQQELKPLIDTLGPRMSVAIGLALRNIAL